MDIKLRPSHGLLIVMDSILRKITYLSQITWIQRLFKLVMNDFAAHVLFQLESTACVMIYDFVITCVLMRDLTIVFKKRLVGPS